MYIRHAREKPGRSDIFYGCLFFIQTCTYFIVRCDDFNTYKAISDKFNIITGKLIWYEKIINNRLVFVIVNLNRQDIKICHIKDITDIEFIKIM